MVISHRHRYLFIQIPNTACTAIAAELCENYGGEPILEKHSTYYDFLRSAGKEQRRYAVFAGIRHPMAVTVTRYFRFATNHEQRFTTLAAEYRRTLRGRRRLRQFEFVAGGNATFPAYFLRFHWLVYNDLVSLLPADTAYVIRYEALNEEFARALACVGLSQVRPLPVVNRTQGKAAGFTEYYTPETRARALRYFGPFLRRWGYSFPEGMGSPRSPVGHEALFRFDTVVRKCFYRYLALRGRRSACV